MKQNNIEEAVVGLFLKCKEMYGDAIEHFWFYDRELCPCCNKSKIDAVKMGDESALSLNGFMYWDMNALIGYLLCSRCVTDLFGNDKKQKAMYNQLEKNLKNGYHDSLKSSAS